MSDRETIPEVGSPIPRGAVSIYGQGDAMDDFPVLKAFQQYVDAEHAKAQKRMLMLCVFFVVLMVAVIGVFMMLLMSTTQRNNALSDQLFQVMLKDRDRQSVIVQPTAQNDSAALLTLQKQLFDQQMKLMEETLRTRLAAAGAANSQDRAEMTDSQRELARAAEEKEAKFRKAEAALKAEREKIAKEKEMLRQQEIELQRRRLYPEYYAKLDREANGDATAAAQPQGQEDDLSDIDAAIAAEEEKHVAPAAAKPAIAPSANLRPTRRDAAAPRAPSAAKVNADGTINYYDDEDDGAAAGKPPRDDVDELVDSIGGPGEWSMPEE